MKNDDTVNQFIIELLDVLIKHPREVVSLFFLILILLILLVVLFILIKSIIQDFKDIQNKNRNFQEDEMKKNKLKKIKHKQKKERLKKRKVKVISPPKNLKEWLIVADSVIGKGHIESNPPLPCQDSHRVEYFNEQWGVAIVSDGLGSKPKSHIGSKFISERMAFHLAKIKDRQWFIHNKLPSLKEWDKLALECLYNVYCDIVNFSKENNYDVSHLASTIIAVVFSPFGLLITHMGDGRAGYCSEDGEWKSMMNPINGEESTQVMPITAPIWKSIDFVKPYIESRVIDEPIKAFTLMSDGCENFCYETQIWDKTKNTCININLPYKGFFNPLITQLTTLYKTKSKEEINLIWKKFLESGEKKIKDELDDKTLIFGILLTGDENL